MAKRAHKVSELKIERPERAKLAPVESLKRMEAFNRRKEQFVAVVRKSKDRTVSA
jgi:hypothetical protein